MSERKIFIIVEISIVIFLFFFFFFFMVFQIDCYRPVSFCFLSFIIAAAGNGQVVWLDDELNWIGRMKKNSWIKIPCFLAGKNSGSQKINRFFFLYSSFPMMRFVFSFSFSRLLMISLTVANSIDIGRLFFFATALFECCFCVTDSVM